ncbi:MAG: hypothetical protein ABW136_06605 [Steroidobacteraceae bacterium]
MISRRQVIGYGVAASALGSLGVSNALERPNASPASIALVVVDERFESARKLASSLASRAVPRIALPQDAFDLWHRTLEAICRSGDRSFAGVTTERGLFLLSTLAAGDRLRILSRSEHRPRGESAALLSWTIGPK